MSPVRTWTVSHALDRSQRTSPSRSDRGQHFWANTPDRAARTAAARAALDERFLAQANGDPQAAKNLRRAYFQRLSLAGAKARCRDREQAETAAELDSLAILAATSELSPR